MSSTLKIGPSQIGRHRAGQVAAAREASDRSAGDVAVVGAGFGGIAAAVALRRAGIAFTVFEKRGIGGIWRDNTYPGCSCDVPSHLYSYSFAPYRDGVIRYPHQADILRYLHKVVDDNGLHAHIRTDTAIVSARWHSAGYWRLVTDIGATYTARVVIWAVGQLHRPYVPTLQGATDYEGRAWHTAEWDHATDLAGRNVAVIGTGSSAAQLIPRIAGQTGMVTVYQRTPPWVMPKPSSEFDPITRWVLRHAPVAHTAYRRSIRVAADVGLTPIIRQGWSAAPAEYTARGHLSRQIRDPGLRAQLTPDYPIGCKRIVFSNDYYPALTRPDVRLVTDPIDSLAATTIRTTDGTHHPTDVIVYATGFRASEFLVPVDVVGRDDASLQHQWTQGARAYLGIAVPGFPNMFLVHGPNTILGTGSNIDVIEYQVDYIMSCLRTLWRAPGRSIEVSPEAMNSYLTWLDTAVDGSVLRQCDSWYRQPATGRVTNVWPDKVRRYRALTNDDPANAFTLVP